MEIQTPITIHKSSSSRLEQFDLRHFEFGKTPTDHLFSCRYTNGNWQEARVEPYHEITLSPFAMCFHYGQTVFEGLKAYRTVNGEINIFRLSRHAERMNESLERMGMPAIPEELFAEGVKALVATEADWIPKDDEELTLYLRPFVIATEPKLGVSISTDYLFMIVASPMRKYYSKNLKVRVEEHFVRAAEGGFGSAKCGGNYGGSFYPTRLANEAGYDQVIWTDAKAHEYIEESGTMNIGFMIDGTFVTPATSSSILDGVTRDSILTLARENGIPTEERKVSVREIETALRNGADIEAFGIGTAAVISPIELIGIHGTDYKVPVNETARIFELKRQLDDIRRGRSADLFGWNTLLED